MVKTVLLDQARIKLSRIAEERLARHQQGRCKPFRVSLHVLVMLRGMKRVGILNASDLTKNRPMQPDMSQFLRDREPVEPRVPIGDRVVHEVREAVFFRMVDGCACYTMLIAQPPSDVQYDSRLSVNEEVNIHWDHQARPPLAQQSLSQPFEFGERVAWDLEWLYRALNRWLMKRVSSSISCLASFRF